MAIIPLPFRYPNYRAYWLSRFLTTIAGQMLVIVIGWQVYDIARQTLGQRDAAFLLGMIGLAQFVPMLALTLVVGVIADRVDRRQIARAAIALQFLCAALLAWLSLRHQVTLPALFFVAFLMGIGRAFAGPSLSALAPNLVPREILPAAIALSAISWQSGAVIGPPLGAFLYAHDPASPYLLAALLFFGALAGLILITPVPRPERSAISPWRSLVEGLGYVRHNRIVLGAISLDLFAVLLGGATAMLPIYARDILHVGVEGLGPLRAKELVYSGRRIDAQEALSLGLVTRVVARQP